MGDTRHNGSLAGGVVDQAADVDIQVYPQEVGVPSPKPEVALPLVPPGQASGTRPCSFSSSQESSVTCSPKSGGLGKLHKTKDRLKG